MPPITVIRANVETRLKKLNPNKSVGLVGVHPRLLKELHFELLNLPTDLIELSSSCQHGFRSGWLVETNLIDCLHLCYQSSRPWVPIDIILLDLAKAFGRICHKRLQFKLQAIGVNENVVEWLM